MVTYHDESNTNIIISKTEIQITGFLSISCCEELLISYESKNDYRLAFARVAFCMYKQSNSEKESVLTEDDFINNSDENLNLILNNILFHDRKIKSKFDACIQYENIYERFYNAFIDMVNSETMEIPKLLDNMTTSLIKGIQAITFPNCSEMLQPIDMPEQTFVLDSIKNTLQKVLLEMVVPIQSFSQGLFIPFLEMTQSLGKKLSEIKLPHLNFELPISLKKYMEEIDYFTERNDLLKRFGWFWFDELPEGIVCKIFDQKDQITQKDVDFIIVQHFRNNKCFELKSIIANWYTLAYFDSRKDVFHQAQVCHARRLYNASTALMTVHFEGIIRDFSRLILNDPRYRTSESVKLVEAKANELSLSDITYRDWLLDNIVLSWANQMFSSKGLSPQKLVEAPDSFRPKIAHGHVTKKETEADSLRSFIYVNELHKLLSNLERSKESEMEA